MWRQIKQENLTVKASEANLTAGKYYFWNVRGQSLDGQLPEAEPRKFIFQP